MQQAISALDQRRAPPPSSIACRERSADAFASWVNAQCLSPPRYESADAGKQFDDISRCRTDVADATAGGSFRATASVEAGDTAWLFCACGQPMAIDLRGDCDRQGPNASGGSSLCPASLPRAPTPSRAALAPCVCSRTWPWPRSCAFTFTLTCTGLGAIRLVTIALTVYLSLLLLILCGACQGAAKAKKRRKKDELELKILETGAQHVHAHGHVHVHGRGHVRGHGRHVALTWRALSPPFAAARENSDGYHAEYA